MANEISVAMIVRDYPPAVGGIPTHAFYLARNLRKIGVKVDVYQGYTDSKTLLLPLFTKIRNSYDIVHIQSLPYASFGKHPTVVTVHSPVLEEGKYYTGVLSLKRPIAVFLESLSLMRADAVVCVSNKTKSDLQSFFKFRKRNLYVIPNGVDTELYKPSVEKKEKPFMILMCSRLERRKNIELALNALNTLDGSLFELYIIGDGPERAKLQEYSTKLNFKPRFLGSLPEEGVRRYFSIANIFLTTSLSEGFGLSLLQAMASGCAVVASPIPAHLELIRDKENGFIYRDSSDLVSILKELLSNNNLMHEFGLKARQSSLAYSWSRIASATKQIYSTLLGKGTYNEIMLQTDEKFLTHEAEGYST